MNQNYNNFIENSSNDMNSQNLTVGAQVSTNSKILICLRCGSEMKSDSRYCMKCGNLNYSHPSNESMKKYAQKNKKKVPLVSNGYSEEMVSSSSGSNCNPFVGCLITNIILHLLIIVVSVLLCYMYSFDMLIFFIVGVVVCFIENFSVQVMFIKADQPWWGYFVPFYNYYLFFKIAMGNGWLFLLLFVPVLGMIFSFISLYSLGKKFYKSGLLMLFFPFIMIPIIAFDKNAEYSFLAKKTNDISIKVDSSVKTQSEKKYGRKKFFVTLIVFIILAVVLFYTWPYLVSFVKKVYDLMMEGIEIIMN